MFKRIEAFIKDALGDGEAEGRDRHDIKLASAALLIHSAMADGIQTADEAQALRDILMRRFELSSEETQILLDEAQTLEKNAVDIHGFTRVLHANLNRDERLEFVRLLWELTHADTKIDYSEQTLVTLIAQLLHVEVHEAVALRQSVTAPGNSS